MAFERLEMRVRPPAENSPASIGLSMWGTRRSGKPIAIVSLRQDIVEKAKLSAASRFHVFIGSGDDAGRLRLTAAADGIVPARVFKTTRAFFVNLGYVERFGGAPARKTPTEARVIADGTVEIDIPAFEFDTPAMAAPAQKRSAEKPAPTGGGAAKKETVTKPINGITIDLTPDSETVSFGGRSIEVTTRQARLVQLLARPRPAPVAESFLVGALWDGRPPQRALEQLRQIAADLKGALAPIGLDLRTVKNVGFQLKDL